MPTLNEIRARRTALTAEARAIVNAAEQAKRSLAADEQTKFDGIRNEITDLEVQEQRVAFLDEQERRATGTVIAGNGDNFAQAESQVSLLRVLQAGIVMTQQFLHRSGR